MSNLIKCDKCGVILPEDKYSTHIERKTNGDEFCRHYHYDLCHDCEIKFEQFMKEKK